MYALSPGSEGEVPPQPPSRTPAESEMPKALRAPPSDLPVEEGEHDPSAVQRDVRPPVEGGEAQRLQQRVRTAGRPLPRRYGASSRRARPAGRRGRPAPRGRAPCPARRGGGAASRPAPRPARDFPPTSPAPPTGRSSSRSERSATARPGVALAGAQLAGRGVGVGLGASGHGEEVVSGGLEHPLQGILVGRRQPGARRRSVVKSGWSSAPRSPFRFGIRRGTMLSEMPGRAKATTPGGALHPRAFPRRGEGNDT